MADAEQRSADGGEPATLATLFHQGDTQIERKR